MTLPSPDVVACRHEVVVTFEDGDFTGTYLRCLGEGTNRACATIYCPVDHEYTSRACIDEHGAEARDECWAESWAEIDRDCLDTSDLSTIRIPVNVEYDEGVVVHEVADIGALLREALGFFDNPDASEQDERELVAKLREVVGR